jgi:hypothetical protein
MRQNASNTRVWNRENNIFFGWQPRLWLPIRKKTKNRTALYKNIPHLSSNLVYATF